MRGFLLIVCLIGGLPTLAQPSGDEADFTADGKGPALYRENGRVGLRKNRHKPLTPAIYDTLYKINDDLFAGKRFSATRQQSLWGIINANGARVLPFSFTVLQVEQNYVIAGRQEHNLIRYGVYSLSGHEIIPPQYNAVAVLSQQYLSATRNNSTLIVNRQGIKVLTIAAEDVSLLSGNLLAFSRYGKTGISSFNRGIIIPASYREVKVENDRIFVKGFPSWQIITGYDTLNLAYDHIQSWGQNYIVTIGRQSWLLSQQGEELSVQYDTLIGTSKNIALAKKGGKWGVIKHTGEEIMPLIYTQIRYDGENIHARVSGRRPQWLLFDFYGFQKTKLRYDSIRPVAEGRIAVSRNGRWGYLDRYGIEVIPPVYDWASQFKHGRAVVTLHGEDGLINRQGKWLSLPAPIKIIAVGNKVILGKANKQYQLKSFAGELIYFTGNRLEKFANGFYERDSTDVIIRKISPAGTFIYDYPTGGGARAGGAGLLIFKANGRYGFKDQQGRIIIANRYEEVKSFNQNRAAVKINNHWGFINLDEQIILQPLYDSVGFYKNGTCIVRKQGLSGVVNLQGETVIPARYQHIIRLNNGNFKVNQQGKWGVLNNNGEVIIHPKYDLLTPVSQGFYIIARNGRYGTLDLHGVNKIPMLYDYIAYDEHSKTLVTKRPAKNEWVFLTKTHPVSN